jgi:hypothetical protein
MRRWGSPLAINSQTLRHRLLLDPVSFSTRRALLRLIMLGAFKSQKQELKRRIVRSMHCA